MSNSFENLPKGGNNIFFSLYAHSLNRVLVLTQKKVYSFPLITILTFGVGAGYLFLYVFDYFEIIMVQI